MLWEADSLGHGVNYSFGMDALVIRPSQNFSFSYPLGSGYSRRWTSLSFWYGDGRDGRFGMAENRIVSMMDMLLILA